MNSKKKAKKGLSGFLPVIIAMFLVFSIYSNFITATSLFAVMHLTSEVAMDQVATEGLLLDVLSESREIQNNVSIVRIVISISLLIAASFLIYLFFKKRRQFPKIFIWFLVVSALHGVMNFVGPFLIILGTAALFDVVLLLPIVLVALVVMLWIISIKRSERIRLTFVN